MWWYIWVRAVWRLGRDYVWWYYWTWWTNGFNQDLSISLSVSGNTKRHNIAYICIQQPYLGSNHTAHTCIHCTYIHTLALHTCSLFDFIAFDRARYCCCVQQAVLHSKQYIWALHSSKYMYLINTSTEKVLKYVSVKKYYYRINYPLFWSFSSLFLPVFNLLTEEQLRAVPCLILMDLLAGYTLTE